MPRPTSVAVRLALYRYWKEGCSVSQIADRMGMARRTVRRLIARFVAWGESGVEPSYSQGPRVLSPQHQREKELAERLRRKHPEWGCGMIRVFLARESDWAAAVRTIQRWLSSASLPPAPAGRRSVGESSRAERPHEVWQMDASEGIPLATGQRVSWLRIVDECTGAVLGTRVFSLHTLERRFAAGNPGLAAELVRPVGPAARPSRGQRLALGIEGRTPHRLGSVADRPRRPHVVEPAAAASEERRGRTVSGNGKTMERTRRMPLDAHAAKTDRRDGRHPAQRISIPRPTAAHRPVPGSSTFRTRLHTTTRTYRLELEPRRRTHGSLRDEPASRLPRTSHNLQTQPLRRQSPRRANHPKLLRPAHL